MILEDSESEVNYHDPDIRRHPCTISGHHRDVGPGKKELPTTQARCHGVPA